MSGDHSECSFSVVFTPNLEVDSSRLDLKLAQRTCHVIQSPVLCAPCVLCGDTLPEHPAPVSCLSSTEKKGIVQRSHKEGVLGKTIALGRGGWRGRTRRVYCNAEHTDARQLTVWSGVCQWNGLLRPYPVKLLCHRICAIAWDVKKLSWIRWLLAPTCLPLRHCQHPMDGCAGDVSSLPSSSHHLCCAGDVSSLPSRSHHLYRLAFQSKCTG